MAVRLDASDDLGLDVPPGFSVSLFAGDDLAHDIYSMTVDSHGRVVVAGAGYVKVLIDSDNDGQADRATLFSSLPASGAHGMCFDGNDLICTGDDAVMRLRDSDGDGVADGPPEILTHLRHPEHGANGLIRGPDGWFYVICGNDAGVGKQQATVPTSPVKDPRCGAVVRISPDGKQMEVVAHGFRNPYSLDFSGEGNLLTVDSDGERDYHLPWYAPARLFDVAQGMEHGWLIQGWTRGWNRPQSFFDSVERMVEIGRGSPTGLVVYRHDAFPAHYRGGVFSACWTLGRVYYFPLAPQDASYRSQLEIFLQTKGDIGFAPCGLAIAPDGDLLVAIGGRKTRGSVFRIRYDAAAKSDGATSTLADGSPLEQVLAAALPLSSWSRAKWLPVARKLGKDVFEQALCDPESKTSLRVRAVEVLADVFDGVPDRVAKKALTTAEPELRARVAWAISRRATTAESVSLLAGLTLDSDPRVARAAWESLSIVSPIEPGQISEAHWSAGLTSKVRRVRSAAISTAQGTGKASYQAFSTAHPRDASSPWTRKLADLRIRLGDAELSTERLSKEFASACVDCFIANSDPICRLEAVRLLQIALGDMRTQPGKLEVYSGYQANAGNEIDDEVFHRIVEGLAPLFPTGEAEVDRELARLMGMAGAQHPSLLPGIASMWTAKSSPEDDIHYLIVASLLPGKRPGPVSRAGADAVLGLQAKLARQDEQPSQNWPLRVGEAFEELSRRDPAMIDALLDHPDFGKAEHALFAARLQGSQRRRAVRELLSRARDNEEEVDSAFIDLIAELPDAEVLPFLRAQWSNLAVRDSVALALAGRPAPEDRARLLEALSSPQPNVVESAARGLARLDGAASPTELQVVVGALKQACLSETERSARESLAALMSTWTGQKIQLQQKEAKDPLTQYAPWFDWFRQAHPGESAALAKIGGADAALWQERLDKIDWMKADSARGHAVFERLACHRCHQASGHLGPELKGAATRLSRDDLLTAIIDPNKEVSPTYQTTVVVTNSGQVYYGLVVYESPEGTLLQTGPDTTVRIAGNDRKLMQKSRQSLMPTGLLNQSTDQDIADLYAYLKTLAPH